MHCLGLNLLKQKFRLLQGRFVALSPLLVVPCFGMATQFLTITVEAIIIKADWDGVIVHPISLYHARVRLFVGCWGFICLLVSIRLTQKVQEY